MPVWNRVTQAEINEVLFRYRYTNLTVEEIAEHIGRSYFCVHQIIHNHMSADEIHSLKRKRYHQSKLGDNNPMTGKTGDTHHNYKGGCITKYGYKLVLKPAWYTSKESQRHIYEHHVVVCEHLGLSAIPDGYSVHHCDMDKLNNDFSNLVLISNAAYTRLHAALRRGIEGATTISKESTLKWVEAHGGGIWHRS